MLTRLYIRNFALIELLDISFEGGFSVITGETGAGKSIVLGAIGLLLGQRADMKSIKTGADRCVVEAHFRLTGYDDMEQFFRRNDLEADLDDTIIRRELTASGKSRSFINDTPVGLTLLKELGERLIDVHSQHQNLLLGKHDFQLGVVDVMGGNNNTLATYHDCYDRYNTAARQLEELRVTLENDRQKADFMRFQMEELTDARLVEDEQQELEAREEMMTHAEDIKKGLYEADNALSGEATGVVRQLKTARTALENIQGVYPEVTELAERLNTCQVELKDIGEEVSRRMENVDFDPAELESVEQRLDLLNSLEKKYRVTTVGELMAIRNDLEEKLAGIDGGDDLLRQRQQEVQQMLAECCRTGKVLSERRRKAAQTIEKEMALRLEALGMPHATFSVRIETTDDSPTPSGLDRLSFLFSANTSSALQPIAQVASGGEIARVMLALKAMVGGKVKLPTIVFDEIDTGVSGKIAEQMALIMAAMGDADRQVISITHLPQIAARGKTHYKVYKEETAQGTVSHMQRLTDEERVEEIAQMLSGSDITTAAYEHAKELLHNKA
jgi:DNA repair protein RecN (Recombination protein N)